MADSLSQWLTLREPADIAARASALDVVATLVEALATGEGRLLGVMDLAAGTGSNFRFLAPLLPTPQRWMLVDHDAALLSEVPGKLVSWGEPRKFRVTVDGSRTRVRDDRLRCDVETRCLDLGALDRLDVSSDIDLVTASALIDLVSDDWLRALAARCRDVGAVALFALSYNGLSRCAPVEPEDDIVLDLFNEHQGRDKGLGGPAAGPDAVECAERAFIGVGYGIRRAPSDWVLGPEQAELQRQLIAGWADAASETAPEMSATIHAWLGRRLAHVDAGRSRVTVCHEEFAAWPATAGARF